MLGYQRGDPVATTVLIRQESPLLVFCEPIRKPLEAEDLLQNTWLQIHKARQYPADGERRTDIGFDAAARHSRVDGYRRSNVPNSFAGANHGFAGAELPRKINRCGAALADESARTGPVDR